MKVRDNFDEIEKTASSYVKDSQHKAAQKRIKCRKRFHDGAMTPVSMGFSGCGQAFTTCNKVFYKVVVIQALSLSTRLSGPIVF